LLAATSSRARAALEQQLTGSLTIAPLMRLIDVLSAQRETNLAVRGPNSCWRCSR
jgi:hypothetical protein